MGAELGEGLGGVESAGGGGGGEADGSFQHLKAIAFGRNRGVVNDNGLCNQYGMGANSAEKVKAAGLWEEKREPRAWMRGHRMGRGHGAAQG